MFRNYFLVTVRSLLRDYSYTVINIAGLSIGIACFLILGAHLKSELTFDQHFDDHQNLYRVVTELTSGGNADFLAMSSRELGPLLKKDYPEVLDFVRFSYATQAQKLILRHKDVSFYWDDVYLADENIFDVFSHDIIYGDPGSALVDPLAIAISESMAKKYFGNENPIGKTLATDSAGYQVSLVFADLPENTHLKYNALLSYNRLRAFFGDDININQALWNINGYTYLKMQGDYKVADFSAVSDRFFSQYMTETGERLNSMIRFFIEPLDEIHLESDAVRDRPKGNRFYIYSFAIIALFILVIACINYMNLATARSVKRAKEIGMRKVIGAHKEQVVMQFLGESLFFSFVSLIIALALVYIISSYTSINDLLGGHLDINLVAEPRLILFLLGLGITVGLVSGLYPAFYLSAIRPITALRGNEKYGGRVDAKLRQLLVFLQFGISIGVITCTILMAEQLRYMQSKPLGYERENKIIISLRGADLIEKTQFIKGDLSAESTILGATGTFSIPGTASSIGINMVEIENNDGLMENQTFNTMFVDEDFINVMGIELSEGRQFTANTDSSLYTLVNETLVQQMGWDDAIGKKIDERTVIGVVKNFHFHSLHRPVGSLILTQLDFDFGDMSALNRKVISMKLIVDIAGTNTMETLTTIQGRFRQYDPEHPFEYVFFDDHLSRLYVSEQRQMQLIGIFAMVCISISCLGLFGLSSFTTTQRTKEIGIRRILGASSGSIIILLFKDIVGLILTASVVASAVSYGVIASWLAEFQYRQDINPLVFLLASSLALGIAFATVAVQSYKTARANPSHALRYEM